MKQLDTRMHFEGYPQLVDAVLTEQGHENALEQQWLMNQFNFISVLVSPHQRAIETAVDILKTHPQLKNGGITLQLVPYCKEILSMTNSWPVSREKLDKFIELVKYRNPDFKFDMSHMDMFEHPKLWLIEILANEKVKKD